MRVALPPRALFALTLIGPVALVGVGAVLTLRYNIAACPLCILQRMLYLAIALVSAFGLVFVSRQSIRIVAALSTAALAACGTAITGYQIYLQRHPFAATCGDGMAWWERLVEQAGQVLPTLFKAEGLCSDDSWSLFGLSIPEYSLLAFCGLFILGIVALFSRQKP
ncbi:MAG: disulfide bond formation protein B [Georgfuchsia sp.]